MNFCFVVRIFSGSRGMLSEHGWLDSRLFRYVRKKVRQLKLLLTRPDLCRIQCIRLWRKLNCRITYQLKILSERFLMFFPQITSFQFRASQMSRLAGGGILVGWLKARYSGFLLVVCYSDRFVICLCYCSQCYNVLNVLFCFCSFEIVKSIYKQLLHKTGLMGWEQFL